MLLSKIEGGPFERVKALIEQAITSGRNFQSKQTNYIHYFPNQKQGEAHHAIPIYENLLFALALLRSRSIEHVNEAKGLISNLLYFQHADGNFPVYLHEYPHCKDHLIGVQDLAPLYWILKHFGHVLGGELRNKLECSFKSLIVYGRKYLEQGAMPHSLSIRLAGALIAGGKLFKNTEWEEQGDSLLSQALLNRDSWTSTIFLADHLIALQMADINIFESGEWKEFGDYILGTWQRKLHAYAGPSVRELQYKFEPLPNVYDLYLGNIFGSFSKRTEEIALYHLQAALIQPSDMVLPECSIKSEEGEYKNQKWLYCNENEWAYSLLEKKPFQVGAENTFAPFKFIWGDSNRVHTLVCQGNKSSHIDYKCNRDHIELYFDLDREIDLQEKEKQREVNFYFDFHPDYQIRINGQTATTFELGQIVTLELGHQKITLTFELVEGVGHFMGHIAHGNRPSQSIHDADLRFESYDWNLFLRTIRRAGTCRLKATIKTENSTPSR